MTASAAASLPGMSDEAVRAATGRDWAQWSALLEGQSAGALDHGAIVHLVQAEGVGDWWSQMVTVGYERMTGRRAPGQRCDGAYSAGASRTVAGDMDECLARWQALVAGQVEFAGSIATSEPRVSASDKWRYWKIDLDDGSRVSINFSDKAGIRPGDNTGSKTMIGANHDKVPSAEAAERAKAFWKALLGAL